MDWKCFGREKTINTFEEMGHKVFPFSHKDYQERHSEDFIKEFSDFADRKNIDLTFSWNYFPTLAFACHEKNITYVSFLYDNPYVMLYDYTLAFETNRVYLFDSTEYNFFIKGGLNNVFYEVLPGDTDRVEPLLKKPYDRARLTSDVSFVGQLYSEEHTFLDRVTDAGDEYLNGYLRGIIEAQKKVAGYNFIEELLDEPILKRMYDAYPYEPDRKSVETPGYTYANYFVNRKITSEERYALISRIGREIPDKLKLFTWNKDTKIPGIKNMGIAEYYNEMPIVFNKSRINLNITLRSIKTGIPLRCMDIMSCGGFLLTNFQEDMLSFFTPGEDFDYYEDENDLLAKIEYYLSHEKERAEIAENALRKVKENHTYRATFERILGETDKAQQ